MNFKITKKLNPFLIVLAFFILLFLLVSNIETVNYIKYVKIAGENIRVELALTKEEQAQGLSGRESLGENEGMLFVFDKNEEHYFWMKGMNFPIDMIWISENQKVIYIKKYAQIDSFLETYGPEENSKYVLEVIAGFSDKYNLRIGDEIEIRH